MKISLKPLSKNWGPLLRAGMNLFSHTIIPASKQHDDVIPSSVKKEFRMLLQFLQRDNCSFHSCTELGSQPVPHGVAFRYDVHVRDIPACFAFIDAHRKHDIPGTFFLMWDYSAIERSRFADYAALVKRMAKRLETGLHDSPVDAYLIRVKFDGDRKSYWNWLNSDSSMDWFSALAELPAELDKLNALVLKDFIARVEQTRKHFGPITAVASHGGEMGQAMRDKLSTLASELTPIVTGLRADVWLTPERIAAAGLIADVNNYRHYTANWYQISDGGGKILRMIEGIKRYAIAGNAATQILIHPYTWDGGKRDGEFSQLLFPATKQSLSSFAVVKPMAKSIDKTEVKLLAKPVLNATTLQLSIPRPDEKCGPNCRAHFDKWRGWFTTTFKSTMPSGFTANTLMSDPDTAMIAIPETTAEYDKLIGDKSRNMVRKALKNGFSFAEIDQGKYLDDIYAIYTSTNTRGGKPMSEAYRTAPKNLQVDPNQYCPRHFVRNFGVLKDGKLYAYCRVPIVGELALFNTILGHYDHLKFGIMNLMIHDLVALFIAEGRAVKALNYLHMASATLQLTSFKKSVGFRPYQAYWIEEPQPDTGDGYPEAEPESPPGRTVVRTKRTSDSVNKLAELIEGKSIKKIIMRGDCCSWRGVLNNRKLFGVGMESVVRDQKAPTIVYLDHLKGISYPDNLLSSHCHLDKMSPSLLRYYLEQNKCETLHATCGDLLVMDSYADAMFQLHEHKKTGAKLWVNGKYFKNKETFEKLHTKLPRRTFDQCLHDIVQYIQHVRSNNPGIPVLYLSQPIHYYPPLHLRREFCYLGAELERIVPDLYWGGHLPPEELIPDDMDSCGPGNTQHYTAETYAKMVYFGMERRY